MKEFLLQRIRLSAYFWILLFVFTTLALSLPRQKFSSGALALFSVNSFLYGFYIAPILSAQKGRIEDLHRIVRSEANAVFAMALYTKKLPEELRNHIQEMLLNYINAIIRQRKASGGEPQYERLITFCIDYKGHHKDDVMKLLDKLVANQQNRTNFAMQMQNPVFTNEWSIMLVLFSITLGFVITMDAGDSFGYKLLAALLCTGLTMLLIILIKLSTLTHKKARGIWTPYKKLIDSRFYRIED